MKKAFALLPIFALLHTGNALAHAQLVSSLPADNGTLAADAKAVTLTFDGLINEVSCNAADAAGTAVAGFGAAVAEREKVRIPITGKLSAGAYIITCKVKADRHEVTQSVKFAVPAPR